MMNQLDIHHVVHDVARSKAAIYAVSKADTPFEDFKWNNEYAVFVTLTDDGTQIIGMEEMVDTAFYQKFRPRFEKYMQEQGAVN